MIARFARRHELVGFFALAYALSATAFGLAALVPGLPYAPCWLIGIFSPTIAAITISFLVGGTRGVRALLAGFTRWRINWRWYLAGAIMVLGPLALALVWIAAGQSVPGPEAGLTVPVLLGQLVFTATSGPLAEEAGWRGFALPRLEGRYGALGASVLLGILWAFWHLPMFFVPGAGILPFPILLPQCVVLAILFAWIYNNSGGSLVATVLAHFWFNFSSAFLVTRFGLMPPMLLYVGGSAIAAALAIAVIVWTGAARLSRHPDDEMPFERQVATARA